MATSQARIEANRKNALKSTGPRTERGKEVSRRNAFKHGLTSVVVIPGEELGLVAGRVAEFQAGLAADGDDFIAALAQEAAMLSVRSERCFRHDEAMTARRVRDADDEWLEGRRAHADYLWDHIAQCPSTNRRQLMGFAEGVDLMLEKLREIRASTLRNDPLFGWTNNHGWILEMIQGRRLGQIPDSDCTQLSRAITIGRYDELSVELAATMNGPPLFWALGILRGLVDVEIATLEAHRATLDPDKHAQDRAEAAERAQLGTDADSTLARRYAASTRRELRLILQEIRAIQDHRQKHALTAAEANARNVERLPEMAEMDPQSTPPLGSFRPPAEPVAAGANASTSAPASPSNRRARRAARGQKRHDQTE